MKHIKAIVAIMLFGLCTMASAQETCYQGEPLDSCRWKTRIDYAGTWQWRDGFGGTQYRLEFIGNNQIKLYLNGQPDWVYDAQVVSGSYQTKEMTGDCETSTMAFYVDTTLVDLNWRVCTSRNDVMIRRACLNGQCSWF